MFLCWNLQDSKQASKQDLTCLSMPLGGCTTLWWILHFHICGAQILFWLIVIVSLVTRKVLWDTQRFSLPTQIIFYNFSIWAQMKRCFLAPWAPKTKKKVIFVSLPWIRMVILVFPWLQHKITSLILSSDRRTQFLKLK